ncbi:hypothetical protein ACFWD7_51505 [Streptomyces mirabilis]|uniref:hypothetical protein n=1 Tax=Streptomyces mirabilis TaxID=68239 RepID=UPI0021BEA1AB|nr:hypothetical protein [Streptomyces mirabilis]MCT9113858.1 hypothetical protein [Streptomyces mirabilis]
MPISSRRTARRFTYEWREDVGACHTLLREAEGGPRATVSALTRHLHIYEDHIRGLTTENASLRAALEAHSDVAIIHPTAQQSEA